MKNILPKTIKDNILFYIIISGTIARLLFLALIVDVQNLDYDEFGILSQNLQAGKGYSFFYFEDDKIKYEFSENSNPLTSAYIPPLQTCIVYPFFFISEKFIRNLAYLLFQIILSLVIILLVYKLTSLFFGLTAARVAALIYALTPEFIYLNGIVSVVLIFHLLTLLFFLILAKQNIDTNRLGQFVSLGLVGGLLTLLRSEIILFLLLLLLVFILKRLYKHSIIFIIFFILIISPWQIRNIIAFNDIVPLTTSFGLNLYRGHNPYMVGVWADAKVVDELLEHKNDKNFELKLNEILLYNAMKSIKDDTFGDLLLSVEKVIKLWLLDYSDPRAKNIFYLVPWFLILFCAAIGLKKYFSWKDYYFIYLFLFYFSFISFIFFTLPRYQTMMKIALIPFAGSGLLDIMGWFKSNLLTRKVK